MKTWQVRVLLVTALIAWLWASSVVWSQQSPGAVSWKDTPNSQWIVTFACEDGSRFDQRTDHPCRNARVVITVNGLKPSPIIILREEKVRLDILRIQED